MSYLPREGTNIAKVYDCITDEKQTHSEIVDQVKKSFPDCPATSVGTHLLFLVKKKAVKKIGNGYLLVGGAIQTPPKQATIKSRIIEYCNSHIGKKVTANQVRFELGIVETSSAPNVILKELYGQGGLQLVGDDHPLQYLVLPEIKIVDSKGLVPVKKETKKQEKAHKIIPKDNIADMSIGQIISEHIALKDENRRLREALQRIAHELYQIGEVEK